MSRGQGIKAPDQKYIQQPKLVAVVKENSLNYCAQGPKLSVTTPSKIQWTERS